jgi:hypothetical protein
MDAEVRWKQVRCPKGGAFRIDWLLQCGRDTLSGGMILPRHRAYLCAF